MRQAYYDLEDTVKAIMRTNRKHSDDCLDILNVIATLMNELDSGRFKGASYRREFNVDRLKITVDFSGEK